MASKASPASHLASMNFHFEGEKDGLDYHNLVAGSMPQNGGAVERVHLNSGYHS